MVSAWNTPVIKRASTLKILQRLIAAVLLSLYLFAGQSAFAWTQLYNYFDSGGTSACGTDTKTPCAYWQEPHYTVGSITTYQDNSLYLNGYDFHPAVNRAIGDFNSAPAYNPNFVTCTSGVCNYYISAGVTACLVYGVTTIDVAGTLESAAGIGYYQFINREHTVFKSSGSWNNSLTWAANASTCQLTGDGRSVATHEMTYQDSNLFIVELTQVIRSV